MKTQLRNITITLEESIARWALMEAARRDTSISRLLAGILKERMLEEDVYQAAMGRALKRKPFLKTHGRYLSREEVHDRARIRGPKIYNPARILMASSSSIHSTMIPHHF